MPGPGNIHEDLQAVFVKQIKEPAGRDVIHAQDAGAQLPQLVQVASRLLARRKHFALRICSKRTVRDPFNVKLFLPEPEEFAIDSYTSRDWGDGSHDCRIEKVTPEPNSGAKPPASSQTAALAHFSR